MTILTLTQLIQQILIIGCLIGSGYTLIISTGRDRAAYERLGRIVAGGSVIYSAVWMIGVYFSG